MRRQITCGTLQMGVDKPIEYREKCVSALARGVIGNTAGFGPAIQGSSPCGPASKIRDFAITKRSPFLFGTVLRQTPLGHLASRRCLGINTYLRLSLPPPHAGSSRRCGHPCSSDESLYKNRCRGWATVLERCVRKTDLDSSQQHVKNPAGVLCGHQRVCSATCSS